MITCEHCGNIIDKTTLSKYATGRFCSKLCSHSFSTAKKRGEINKKVSQTLKEKHLKGELTVHNKGKSNKKQKVAREPKKTTPPKRTTKQTQIKVKVPKTPKQVKMCSVCGSSKGECPRPDICKRKNSFNGLATYLGLDISFLGTTHFLQEYERIKNKIYEEYWNQQESVLTLSNKYNHKRPNDFVKILKSLGLTFRSVSESCGVAYVNGRHKGRYRYKYSEHTTWNGKKVFLRSSHEIYYAKKLDELKIDYEVEKLQILYWDFQKNIQRIAIPDFYLTETNTIVEIKASYFWNEQNMKDKFKSYRENGYKTKLIFEKEEKDF